MDPNQLAVFLGLLTNGLYSLILLSGHKVREVEDLAFRVEDIHECLMRNKASFALIIEGSFQDLPPVIEPEEFCEFLDLDQTKDIIKRIYSFDESGFENKYNLETIKTDFSYLLYQYFNEREEVSTVAPHLFSILIKCCQKSLETIIKEEQDLAAIDAKLTFFLKNYAAVLSNCHDNLFKEIRVNQESLDKLHIKFNEFDHKFENGLIDLPKRIKLELQSCSSTHSFINMAPDLEMDFIPRDSEYNKLIESLLKNQRDTTVAVTSALKGAGGYGKTTLAKAVCNDPKIKERFSDGILWVTLGENPGNLIPHLKSLFNYLSRENRGFGTLDSATIYLRDLLAEKRVLIVIDDVWNSVHLEPFLHGGPYCAHLITTRNDDTLPPETLRIFVDSMLEKEAIGILRYRLFPENENYFNKLAERLGYWPLLLKLVNGTLQYRVNELKESIDHALDFVNNGLIEEGLIAFDKEDPKSRSQAVEATLAVSLKALNKEEYAHYFELAIFPEDVSVPLKVLEKLWNKTGNFSSYRVKRICTKFYSMSLLLNYDTKNDSIRLHDVVREYLMIKQKKKFSFLHSQFLDAFKIERWVDLPGEETYLWKNLSYHLVEAERKEELRKLLFDFNWMQSKLDFTDVHFLISDYNFFHEDYPVEMMKGAIQLSANALSKDKKLLDGQLLGRLELFSETEIKLMLEYIRAHKNGIRILPLTGSLKSPGEPLLCTLEGHSAKVNAVSITPDGNYAVSASDDNTLKVWDIKTGKKIHTLEGHSAKVNVVFITSDGNYVVSASNDNTLKVWDIKTGKEIHTLKGYSAKVNVVSITSDGNYVVSASNDNTLKVWDIKTGKEVQILKSNSILIRAVSITPDGNYAVLASDTRTLKFVDLKTRKTVCTLTSNTEIIDTVSGTLEVWNLRTGKKIHTFEGHSSLIKLVSITPDGNYAISASDDNTLKVWDIKTKKAVRILKGHSSLINAISITPNGNYAVSASNDSTLKVWDFRTGEEVHNFEGHSSVINVVSISSDGNYAVSASNDNTLKVWDLKTGKEVHTLEDHFSSVRAVSITSDGNYAVSASSDNTLKVWDIKTKKAVHTFEYHFSSVRAVSITPDGNYAISASDDNTLKVWDIKTKKAVRTLKGHFSSVKAVSITPDGNYAVSASTDSTLKVWDIKTGKEIHTLKGHFSSVRAVSITSDGNYAVSASSDNTLKVWDIKTKKAVHTFEYHFSSVRAVSITPDGNYAISASDDNTLKVWDIKTKKAVRTLKGHFSSVKAVSITPDGNYAVSASDDSTLKVWDIKTGKEIHNLEGHLRLVSAVSITPDGNYAVSASNDSTLKVWDIKTGKEIHTLKGHLRSVRAVSISSDGNYAISASSDKMLKVWDLKIGKEISAFSGESPFLSVVFFPDSTIVFAGEKSGRIHFLLFEE